MIPFTDCHTYLETHKKFHIALLTDDDMIIHGYDHHPNAQANRSLLIIYPGPAGQGTTHINCGI